MSLIVSLACTALAGHRGAFGGPAPVTTIITHGFSTGEKGAWVQGMAEAILARTGGGSIYRYTEATAAWTYVPVAAADGTNDVVVLIFNWVPESDAPTTGANWNYAQAAGDALYAHLRDPVFIGAASPPASLVNDRLLHFIGHSRGASVCSEAIIRLARDGNVPVDQFTALDAHPVNGTLDAPLNFNWNDPTPRRWSNVTWADAYWRADGGLFNALDFDGIPVDGAFNTQLSESALNCCAYSFAHLDVHLWLHGTIDLSPAPCDGEQCINQTMRDTWWPEGYTQRGWFYSALGGGSALRPAIGPATTPPATPFIVGGDFDDASHAGWSFHGGSVGGQIVSEGGVDHLRIGAGIGSGAFAQHNRLYLSEGSTKVELDSRVLTAANPAGEQLRIMLIEQNATSHIVVDDPIANTAGGWIADRQFAIPASVPRDRTYTLRFEIVSSAGATAVVGLDNIDLIMQTFDPADINADGCVNVNDLLAVIANWGVCPPLPASCPADVDDDGAVEADDLLAVITNWGCVRT